MNLHEYQGKEILSSFGVRVQRGIVAQTPTEAVEAAKQLTEATNTQWYVVKAQVHAGGRGKGGGIKLAKGLDQVEPIASQIIGIATRYASNATFRKKSTSSAHRRRCILPWRKRT